MGFNYAQEKRTFEKQWSVTRQQYENVGMSPNAIEELHNFDWDWFKSRRRYINHLADLPEGVTVEDFPQADTERSVGDTPLHYGTGFIDDEDRWHWLEEIEDTALLKKLLLLSWKDLKLLTLYAIEDRRQDEISKILHCNQSVISRKLARKKIFAIMS